MSYCMWNNDPDPDEEYCDIYLYGDIEHNAIICFWCCMHGCESVALKTRTDAIRHMELHRSRGDRAPYDRVISKLQKEIEEEGDEVDFGGPEKCE